MRRYVVTGGAGFIGSNFVRHVLEQEPTSLVVNLDLLTYAGVEQTVVELDSDPRHTFLKGDIGDPDLLEDLLGDSDVVVNFAAESHVDRSIVGPSEFLTSNVVGAGTLFEVARKAGVPKVIQVSTDEVYGSVSSGFAGEDDPLRPSSPYSASKAAADLLAFSYSITYDYPITVTRCTNNYGPFQFPEKVIPLFITNLMEGKRVPLYGDGENERDWLHVKDHCAALHMLVDEGQPGEIYNIGANGQVRNIELTYMILDAMGVDESWIVKVPDRPGHDLRYAVDSTKVRSLGWAPEHSLSDGLELTIAWYKDRTDWWKPLKEAA